ncbi:Uncharacterised protein [Actinomyces bovis]|uniref:Antitoxin HicB n=1 Tax=Actinomyces bovis TaxID=1658 RepID=A0ABY1VPW7_9ACTO|nr:hypothetical protein [Actinomyces bovis]SPT53782.1 Uncharacterised protein [Actinomyces bovis]VEG53132.1 Uncharacterised protein [Actinomyces israelii]
MTKTFTVTAQRGKGDWWVLEVPEVGAVSQVKRLDQAAEEMREAVAYLSGLEAAQVNLQVIPVLPDAYQRHALAAAEARKAAAEATSLAAAEARTAARALREAGLTLRDVGTIMGVSHQRAAQLAG